MPDGKEGPQSEDITDKEDLTDDQSRSNLINYKLLKLDDEIEQRRVKLLQELEEEKQREIIKINSDVLGSLKDHLLDGIHDTVNEALYVSAKMYELEKNLEIVIDKWKFSLTDYNSNKSLEHKTLSEFGSDDLARYNVCVDYAKDISTLRKFTNKYVNIFDNLQETINLFETERDLDPQIFDLELEKLVELHKSDSMSKGSIINYLSNHDDIDYSTIDRMAFGILTTYTKFVDLDIYASQLLHDGTIPQEFCPVEHINFEEFETAEQTTYHG